MSLYAFWLGPDTVIARSPAHALIVWEEHTSEEPSEYDLFPDDAYQVGDETELSIIYDWPLYGDITIPPLARWDRHGQWKIVFTAPAKAWVKTHGPGFLCSSEY